MNAGIFQFLYLGTGILFFLAFSGEKKIVRRSAVVLGCGTLALHLFFLVRRSLEAWRPPLTNMYETLHLLAFLVTLLFFLARFKWPIDLIGGFAGLTSALLMASSAIASPEIEPLLPVLKSNWLLFHVTACFIAYSSFALAAGTALAYLWVDGVGRRDGARANLLKKMEGMTHRIILFGYPLLTLGIATGSIWAQLSWGRYWNWDPKETWAFATWMIYTAYLHLKYDKAVHPRAAAAVVVLAFGLVLFTYYGVNFWLSTLHQYA
ncbi:MAG: c-type cytochrome biogenesis protein CcsB [Candidatus Omnitrophica bacterium]|nr:c-type cytochrome biogenesis protein CcsB [Candidatus Omnitrophota bacterium]